MSGQPPVSITMGVTRASQAVNRCSASVRVCPREVVHTRSPSAVVSRVTDTLTGSPPRLGIDPLACAALTRATSPSARRADAGTWSASVRNRSANASTAAITASPSRRGSTPDRTTESAVRANDNDRDSYAPASSGSGSAGGCSTRITRAMNPATAWGTAPHHGINSLPITAASSTRSRRCADRAIAST